MKRDEQRTKSYDCDRVVVLVKPCKTFDDTRHESINALAARARRGTAPGVVGDHNTQIKFFFAKTSVGRRTANVAGLRCFA